MNVNLFKAKLVEKGMNVEHLAAEMGLNTQTIYNKLKKDGFKTSEVRKIGAVLSLSGADLCEIFLS